MPHLRSGSGGSAWVISSHQLYPNLGRPLEAFCHVWTFPGSVLLSGALLVACCVVLVRRGRKTAALAWASAWLLANAAEVLGKSALHRPTLHMTTAGATLPLPSFDNSFPSGHAVRAVVITALLAAVWRRAGWPALAWALVALPALVVGAAHTPSDVLGGALLAFLAVLGARIRLQTQAPGKAGAAPRAGLQAAILEEQ
jgi:membrane-associated phospholipid phosphatase